MKKKLPSYTQTEKLPSYTQTDLTSVQALHWFLYSTLVIFVTLTFKLAWICGIKFTFCCRTTVLAGILQLSQEVGMHLQQNW